MRPAAAGMPCRGPASTKCGRGEHYKCVDHRQRVASQNGPSHLRQHSDGQSWVPRTSLGPTVAGSTANAGARARQPWGLQVSPPARRSALQRPRPSAARRGPVRIEPPQAAQPLPVTGDVDQLGINHLAVLPHVAAQRRARTGTSTPTTTTTTAGEAALAERGDRHRMPLNGTRCSDQLQHATTCRCKVPTRRPRAANGRRPSAA